MLREILGQDLLACQLQVFLGKFEGFSYPAARRIAGLHEKGGSFVSRKGDSGRALFWDPKVTLSHCSVCLLLELSGMLLRPCIVIRVRVVNRSEFRV